MFSIVLFGSCGKKGCTDPVADNYDHTATKDDASCVYPDTTYIPDPNFEIELISLGYDNEYNGWVLTDNIKNVSTLALHNKQINDLTGLEDFINLQNFYAGYSNNYTVLDLSNQQLLQYLNVEGKSSFDLILGDKPVLVDFYGATAQFASGDFSSCPSLNKFVSVDNLLLTSLSFKTGTNTTMFGDMVMIRNCPNLTCVEVDDANYSATNWSYPLNDTTFIWSENCP